MKIRTLLLGGMIGYVLGARAGRKRYEQIKNVSSKVWNSKPVQSGVGKAKDAAGEATEELKNRAVSYVPFVNSSGANKPGTAKAGYADVRDGSDDGSVRVTAVEF
ncbi:hypothetical protein VR010_13615 [Actinomycetaceae bacterium L2_0104]